MINCDYSFIFIEGLPEEYGMYLFVLNTGIAKEGYYSSFPYPNERTVKFCNIDEEDFYYDTEHILGYFMLYKITDVRKSLTDDSKNNKE